MFEQLIEDIKKCRYCEEKFGFTPHPVVWGNKNAKIAQISQAPSIHVHKSMRPFTDASGKVLKNEWYQITDEKFYNQDNFYIVSMAHCYPGKDSKGNDKLPPKECYEKWVSKEIEFLENEIFIIVGARAASTLFPKEKFEDLVFQNKTINNKPAFIIPHPSPLNKKWLKDHPEFLTKRIIEIRKIIKNTIK